VGDVTTDSPASTATPPTATAPTATGTPTDASDVSATTRYRCAACGNLTRFDVVTTRRTRAFHHYSVGGDLTVEEVEVLDESVEEVTCRWCGNGKAVEEIEPGAAESS
jgi:DNA-directed RNA polymerase subunit M/transcription elongation factor TFIIS